MSVTDQDGVTVLALRDELTWDLQVAKAKLREKDTPSNREAVEAAYDAFDDLHEVGGLRDCE